jgi:hypothetical protein
MVNAPTTLFGNTELGVISVDSNSVSTEVKDDLLGSLDEPIRRISREVVVEHTPAKCNCLPFHACSHEAVEV